MSIQRDSTRIVQYIVACIIYIQPDLGNGGGGGFFVVNRCYMDPSARRRPTAIGY